jgi:hypothetical protein
VCKELKTVVSCSLFFVRAALVAAINNALTFLKGDIVLD